MFSTALQGARTAGSRRLVVLDVVPWMGSRSRVLPMLHGLTPSAGVGSESCCRYVSMNSSSCKTEAAFLPHERQRRWHSSSASGNGSVEAAQGGLSEDTLVFKSNITVSLWHFFAFLFTISCLLSLVDHL